MSPNIPRDGLVNTDYVGSLVVPTAGDRQRPTNWDGVTPRPAGITWAAFPGLVERAENQCGFPQYMTPVHSTGRR